MTLDIQIQAWDRYKNVADLNRLMGSNPLFLQSDRHSNTVQTLQSDIHNSIEQTLQTLPPTAIATLYKHYNRQT